MASKLDTIHQQIDQCTVCSEVPGFVKPGSLFRGVGGILMIIGQGPGKTEVSSGKAFSGQSGTRLDEWLVEAGAPKVDPRRNVYTTSVIKCGTNDKHINTLIRNCREFLVNQISEINPIVIWTLGAKAFESLNITTDPYDKALFSFYDPSATTLLNEWGVEPVVIPMPHPSGMNRILNDPEIRDKAKQAAQATAKLLEQHGVSL